MLRELALFAGAGGGLLGSKLSGHRTVCAVELDPYCRRVLLQRQHDGWLDRFPIWDDVRTFDGRPWGGRCDIVSGGFPCQDISSAGSGEGLAGERSGLWFDMLRIIGEVRPRFVFAENSPRLRTLGLGTVIKGLASLGYDARWCVLGARHVGAPHRRDRMWILAYAQGERPQEGREVQRDREVQNLGCDGEAWLANANDTGQRVRAIDGETLRPLPPVARLGSEAVANTHSEILREQSGRRSGASTAVDRGALQTGWTGPAPIARMDDGMAHRVDRTKATGNGQVPAVAALAWATLSAGLV
ncbi:MAG: DNA cytosine methyltransferase [Rickettsiales bacterium]|nr:MAG: DNA cytosine methyltransferase [Rickettsiales bacterium]